MSIFSKQIQDIVFEDIQELLDDKVQENIRLEYKKELPPKKEKDEFVKKISSMSNTYGGYLVVGIKEDGKGNPKSICGVPPKKGFKQQVVDWCFNEVYPPITPFVSNPITNELVKNTVIYVIYLDMSLDSPHFLTKRRGCYIRTDEYSKRFEPRLTTYEDIKFLSNRRKEGDDKREYLIDRSRKRFEKYKRIKHPLYKNTRTSVIDHEKKPSFLHVNLILQYPHTKLVTEYELVKSTSNIRFHVDEYEKPRPFPSRRMYSQFESVIFPYPTHTIFSYLELNVHGQFSYFEEISEIKPFTDGSHEIIEFLHVFSRIVLTIICGKRYYRELGYDGQLNFRVRLDNLIGKKIFSDTRDITLFDGDDDERFQTFHFSLVDDSMEFEMEISTHDLKNSWKEVCMNMWRNISFSLDENHVVSEKDLLLQRA